MVYPFKKKRNMLRSILWLLACGLIFTLSAPVQGRAATEPYSLSLAWLRADDAAMRQLPWAVGMSFGAEPPGLLLAVTADPTVSGMHLYAGRSQIEAGGMPTEISAVLADGTPVPFPAIFPRGAEKADPLRPGERTRVYEGPVTILIPVPRTFPAGETLLATFSGLACGAENCTPLSLNASIAVPDAEARNALPDAALAPWWETLKAGTAEPMQHRGPESKLFRDAGDSLIPLTPGFSPGPGFAAPIPPGFAIEKITPAPFTPGLEVSSLGKAVLLGFMAGVILNLMPCVLPVLGIKLGALLQHAATAEGMRRFRRHQVFFALGILAWFTALAGIFYWLDLAWGQIFQSPAVVIAVAVALLLLAMNLFGALSLPLVDFRAGNPKNPDARAFAGGVTATLLATPCGGPLLGGVLSWALTQPLGIMTLTLESVGLGMAFPYLALAAFPSLASRLPRPGPWMGVMEHFLGFLLLATVAYLVSFLPAEILPRVVAALVLAAFGGWLWGLGGKAGREFMRGKGRPEFMRAGLRLCAVLCVALAVFWPLAPRSASVVWREYSQAAFALEAGKRMILVDFTADWCPTCKVVEATALNDASVKAWRDAYDLALFRVDLTRPNPEGEALLRAVGSASIPVIAVFGTGDDAYRPLVLRDIVTGGQIEAALERMAAGGG